MKFLSQEDLLLIAHRTAYPSSVTIRSPLVLETVLTMPTHQRYAARHGEGRIVDAASVFATLLVRMKPFSKFNLEIACNGIGQLLATNELGLGASPEGCHEQLKRVATGDHSVSDLSEWIEAHCTSSSDGPSGPKQIPSRCSSNC
jgi:hypothetical protein